MKKTGRILTFSMLVAALGCAPSAPRTGWWKPPADAPEREMTGPFKNLSYRLIGPATGGRVTRVVGIPGDPHVYWVSTAAGGVWRSVNGGRSWSPVFDDQPISSIGSIAVAPSNPNVIWVGSGEANIRGNVAEGNGIYRSTDGGATWSHAWKAEGQIGEIIVHPEKADVAFAAVLGSPFGPGEDRGVFRTVDGGKTWTRVLYVDEDSGASDICFDPNNSKVMFAGTWQTRRTPWSHTSGGPGSGLWRSGDGGTTWSRLQGSGLPGGVWGKVGVQVAATDSKRVYALIEAEEGGLFRSDDGGTQWRRVNDSGGLRQRAWYYTHLTIDPTDADTVWFPEVRMLHTADGGKTVRSVAGGGWDYHDVWIDPRDPSRIAVGSDAGVSLSWDGGKTWHRPDLPISQLYHVSVDTQKPYKVLASVQDLGTVSGPSHAVDAEAILLSHWHNVGGGEAGYVVADPSDPNIVWAGEYLGIITRYDHRTGRSSAVGAYPYNGSGHGAEDLKYRFQWTAPIVISPHDSNVVYHAANVLFRTDDRGQSWTAVSPDLTRNDPSKQKWSGGPITGDNTGVEFYNTIFAVAESIHEAGTIWVGTDDGLVHITRDFGQNWSNVTPPDLPEWATVSIIEASRFDPAVAYVVADAHRLDDETPYLWKTADYGASWTRLGTDLDPEVYLHVVREDTQMPGLLYLGTERGVLVSHNDGKSWRSLKLNMPTVSIPDLVVAGDDLVVGTLGRSIWILDDLGPIRSLNSSITASSAHLFPVPDTVLRTRVSEWSAPKGSREGAGTNPPFGASFTYWLGVEPAEPFRIEVVDSTGQVIRTLSSELEEQFITKDHPDWRPTPKDPKPALSKKVGLNRATWDTYHAHSDWIRGAANDIGGWGPGPRAVPGEYTLRLKFGDVVQEQPFKVQPDPKSEATADTLQAQLEFGLKLRADLNAIVGTVREIRRVRAEVEKAVTKGGEARERGAELVKKLDAIESELHAREARVSYDVLGGRNGGAKLFSVIAFLAGNSLDHEGPPTRGMVEIAEDAAEELAAQQAALREILDGEFKALMAM
ncbi:MAG: glycosyl hydrolase [Myxococcota bacterium]